MLQKRSWPRVSLIISSLLLLLCAATAAAQGTTEGTQQEQKTASYFETLRNRPPQQFAFLLQMPKGADLHNHLSGAIYAESYIDWAVEKKLCVNPTTFVLSSKPCEPNVDGLTPIANALTNPVLYRQIVDAWSTRNWQLSGQSGHDRFFDTFPKFGPVSSQLGRMLAEETARAARGQLLYLELMLTPDGGTSYDVAQKAQWDDSPNIPLQRKLEETLQRLKAAGIDKGISQSIQNLREAERQKDEILKCGKAEADPGCNVRVRYVFQVSRGGALSNVYAQMVEGFMLASDPQSKVVALNLVQPEDWYSSLYNFDTQMRMLDFLHNLYPKAHITLHAGELAPGLVPPKEMMFHIRSSVMMGHAERIGHGVDIMHETNPFELLTELARRSVMIEICLTSNEVILGIRGAEHPLATYIEYGVPVALATDDEGVSRSEISREYLKAAEEQGLGYIQLKMMARTSLQYSFISGVSLWSDPKNFRPTPACVTENIGQAPVSKACQQFLAASEKANLQWELERKFKEFESKY